jgi:hypothetical protein
VSFSLSVSESSFCFLAFFRFFFCVEGFLISTNGDGDGDGDGDYIISKLSCIYMCVLPSLLDSVFLSNSISDSSNLPETVFSRFSILLVLVLVLVVLYH